MTIIDNPKQPTEPDTPFGDEKISKTGDKVFFGLSFGAATLILVTLGAVALFLVVVLQGSGPLAGSSYVLVVLVVLRWRLRRRRLLLP